MFGGGGVLWTKKREGVEWLKVLFVCIPRDFLTHYSYIHQTMITSPLSIKVCCHILKVMNIASFSTLFLLYVLLDSLGIA